MEKKIEDYLHLYLGCKVETEGAKIKTLDIVLLGSVLKGEQRVVPFLRSLASMTYDEWLEGAKIHVAAGGKVEISLEEIKANGIQPMRPEVFLWALSKHFDLFNLHQSGLCIYQ